MDLLKHGQRKYPKTQSNITKKLKIRYIMKEHLPQTDDDDFLFLLQQQHPQNNIHTIINKMSTIKKIKYITILGKYFLIFFE